MTEPTGARISLRSATITDDAVTLRRPPRRFTYVRASHTA
jgi:hypothetical protein